MTFQMIPNPLGSGGYNIQPLPDMTGGIQALQKTEINRRLQEIQQNKEWERQDRLKNEERALKLMMPPAYDGIAGYNAEQFQEKADSYRKFWADKMAATNGNLQMKDWAEVQSKYRELESSVMHGQAKKQAFSEYQRQALTTRNKLETEEEKARFDEQQKVLFDKIFTQKTDWTPYDLMEALQVPERPTRVSVSDFGKEQYGAFTNDGKYDPEATKKNISVRLSRYPDLIKGVNVDYNGIDPSDPRVNDVSSAANAIYQELEPKLKGKPTQGREPAKYERFSGFVSENAKSTIDPQYTGKMFVIEDFGTPVIDSFTIPGTNRTTSAEIVPLRLREDGYMEIRATVQSKETTEPMDYGQALFLENQTGGSINIADDGKFTVTYSRQKEYTSKKKYEGAFKDQIERRLPSIKGFKLSNKEAVNTVKRRTKDGRIAIFNADTKEFIRYE